MKIPTIEQDVLPSVQTSRALKYDIERRSEIPVAKGGVAVAAAVSSLADSLTGIGDKMRDAEISEEYYRKRTDLMTQSHQIMTDIQTKDPNFKNYTEEELFNIYNEKANTMKDGLFGDIKWAKVKEKLSNDYELTDVNNRTNLQVAGWKNTIVRAEQDMNNHLTQYSNLAADSGELGTYNQFVDSELAGRVSLGIITPEEAVTKKTTYNNNTIAMYSDKYITEGIKTGAVYKESYNNLVNQINTLQDKGIVVSPHIKAQILGAANSAYNTRLGQDREWLNKEGNDVCQLYILSGQNRHDVMTNGKSNGKLDRFGDQNLTDDFKRNWEIALLQREKALERQHKDTDTQLNKSMVDAALYQGVYREDMLQYIKDPDKKIDTAVQSQLALEAYKQFNVAKQIAPAQEYSLIESRDKHAAELSKSEDPNVLRQLNWFNDYTNYMREGLNKKHTLLANDPYTYVTDPKWLGVPLLVASENATQEQKIGVRTQNFQTVEQAQLNMGVPRERIAFMSLDQVKQDVTYMTQSDPVAVKEMLQNRIEYFGPKWESVQRQYVKNGAPPAFQVLSFVDSPSTQRRATDLFGTTETKIKESAKAIDPNLNSNEVENRLRKELAPYLQSRAYANFGQPGMIDEETNGLINGLNMYTHSMIADRYDKNDAVKATASMINDKFSFRSTYRVPKQYNADIVSDFLTRTEMNYLPKLEYNAAYNSPADKEIMLRQIRWVTDKSNQQVILTRSTGDPVLKADGKLVKFSFSDIISGSMDYQPAKGVTMTLPEIMNQPIPEE